MSIHLGTLISLGTSEARPEPCPLMLSVCVVLVLALYCVSVGLLVCAGVAPLLLVVLVNEIALLLFSLLLIPP
jgi:hypothetical protein